MRTLLQSWLTILRILVGPFLPRHISNPFSKLIFKHRRNCRKSQFQIADKHKISIIADEIYGGLVYGGAEFHPLATLEPKVPILACDGLSKRYVCKQNDFYTVSEYIPDI